MGEMSGKGVEGSVRKEERPKSLLVHTARNVHNGPNVMEASMLGVGITVGYIDPGTGSFLLQTAIAGVIGVFFYFRAAVKRVVSLLFRRKGSPPSGDQNASKE